MEAMEQIITAKKLSAGYKNHTVWSNASFLIEREKFVAVLGPNGAGKTTLFRLLLGLTKPKSGELTIFGQNPKRGNIKIGYVPQRHLVDSEIQIESIEFVRLGLSGNLWGFSLKAKHEFTEAMNALKAVDAEELAHRPLGTLSGGEVQRVFLAQALVGKPDLLLLDEPLSNLDIRREINFVDLIENVVKSRGVTALLIAHNINPLLGVLDQVIYIAAGKVASGKPKEILTSSMLSELYGTSIEVLHDSKGRMAVIGAEESVHHHYE